MKHWCLQFVFNWIQQLFKWYKYQDHRQIFNQCMVKEYQIIGLSTYIFLDLEANSKTNSKTKVGPKGIIEITNECHSFNMQFEKILMHVMNNWVMTIMNCLILIPEQWYHFLRSRMILLTNDKKKQKIRKVQPISTNNVVWSTERIYNLQVLFKKSEYPIDLLGIFFSEKRREIGKMVFQINEKIAAVINIALRNNCMLIIPHATSCGGYNVFDPSVSQSVSHSVRQSCFSC